MNDTYKYGHLCLSYSSFIGKCVPWVSDIELLHTSETLVRDTLRLNDIYIFSLYTYTCIIVFVQWFRRHWPNI